MTFLLPGKKNHSVARKIILYNHMYPLTSEGMRNLTAFAPGKEGGRIPDFIITRGGIMYF